MLLTVSENLFEKGFGDTEEFLAIAEETEDFSNIFLTLIFSYDIEEILKFNKYLAYLTFF